MGDGEKDTGVRQIYMFAYMFAYMFVYMFAIPKKLEIVQTRTITLVPHL